MLVEEVWLRYFRGAGPDISLQLERGMECLVLLGDNGSGKSTIVDAIEFALRGRLSRRGPGGEKYRREIKNLTTGFAPGVAVAMVDGSRVRRGRGKFAGMDAQLLASQPLSGFEWAPVVVRRQDIERFWGIPALQRQEFFFDFLRDAGSQAMTPQRFATLQAEESRLKASIAEGAKRIREGLGSLELRGVRVPTSSGAVAHVRRRLDAEPISSRTKAWRYLTEQALPQYEAHLREHRRVAGELRAAQPEASTAERLSELLPNIADNLSRDFMEITSIDWLDRIELSFSSGAELGIHVYPLGQESRRLRPEQVLSEASLDLLALLLLVEMHRASVSLGQKQLLILDDVFQSVDATYRIRALDHIAAKLAGWQLIFASHDRMWVDLIGVTLRKKNRRVAIKEVVRRAPGILEIRPALTSNQQVLRRLLAENAHPQPLVSSAGVALEQLCDSLSVSLATSVTRRPNDRYTLGDLWPGVEKALRKSGLPGAAELTANVSSSLTYRNIVGAHFNSWTQGVSQQEAEYFAKAVLRLIEQATCSSCASIWTQFRATSGNRTMFGFACRCRAIVPAQQAVDDGE